MEMLFVLDIVLGVVFIGLLLLYLFWKRSTVKVEKIAFPLFYAILHRDTYGIKKMEKWAQRHKGIITIFGYTSIGVGFVGMILALLMILQVAWQLIFVPKVQAVAPFLPFTELPVFGYISFTHWIIVLFVIIIVHEAAHGIVALAHGLKLKSTGFGLFAIIIPFIPAAFVEPDEKQLRKAPEVVQYSMFAAGPMANFVLAIPLLLLLLFVISPIENSLYSTDGFTVDVINDKPAYFVGIENGTTFNTIDGRPIHNVNEFISYMQWTVPGQNLYFSNIHGNVTNNSFVVLAVEHPDYPGSGFVGVTNMRNNVIVSQNSFVPFFSWFKGLISLMFMVTISIGLINLFPAAITDGGQMLRLALDTHSKNKDLNARIIGGLAMFFLIVILFGFVTYFTGNPFSLFFGS